MRDDAEGYVDVSLFSHTLQCWHSLSSNDAEDMVVCRGAMGFEII